MHYHGLHLCLVREAVSEYIATPPALQGTASCDSTDHYLDIHTRTSLAAVSAASTSIRPSPSRSAAVTVHDFTARSLRHASARPAPGRAIRAITKSPAPASTSRIPSPFRSPVAMANTRLP